MNAEECDAVEWLRGRLERRQRARGRAKGAERDRLDVEIGDLERTLDDLILARRTREPRAASGRG